MSIADIISDLQALHALMVGVTAAPIARPTKVSTAQLPCVLIRPGAQQISLDSRQTTDRVRSFTGVCLVGTPNQGRGIAETLTATHTLLDAFATRYTQAITDGETAGDGVIVRYQDNGEPDGLIDYQGTLFEGFTFQVDVWEG